MHGVAFLLALHERDMYDDWSANALVVFVTALSVALAVLVHYEGLALLNQRLVRVHARRRRKVLLGVYGVILLHVVEIWLFGLACWLLLLMPGTGALSSMAPVAFLDAVYLSAETFTTVGFGTWRRRAQSASWREPRR